MTKDKTWCDDVFLQIAANILNRNVILIPLSPSSAHHAGMYQEIRSFNGGEGDPFYMLYFEEWRTAGHYQSLEPDTNAGYNLVIAHYNWRLKSFSNILSDASCAASVPTPPQPPVAAPATAPAPSCTVTAVSQLQSTRQRIESEGSMYVT